MESEGEGAMNPRRWKKDECRERDSQQENYAANRELMPTFNFIARGIRTSYLERCCCYYMMMRCTCVRGPPQLDCNCIYLWWYSCSPQRTGYNLDPTAMYL